MSIWIVNDTPIHTQKQIEKHVIRYTKLSELLHMTNEKPITVRDENLNLLHEDTTKTSSTASDAFPVFVGPFSELHINTLEGLPKHIPRSETQAIFRAIKLNTANINHNRNAIAMGKTKPVIWQPPILACKAMVTHFINRQLPTDDDDRQVRVILRAQPFFQNKPSHANVKVAVESDTGVKLYFAKCIVFLKDSQNDYYVVLQWYNQEGNTLFDAVSGLVQVVLRPPNVTTSYSVMPIDSIVNGALITKSEDKLWVLLSPRESQAYAKTNG